MDTAKVESEYQRLREQRAAGRLTGEEFETQLKELMCEDEQGRWWMIGPETGEWYRHDGQEWVRGEPPAPTSESSGTAVVIGSAPGSGQRPGRRIRWLTFATLFLSIAACVGLFVSVGSYLSTGDQEWEAQLNFALLGLGAGLAGLATGSVGRLLAAREAEFPRERKILGRFVAATLIIGFLSMLMVALRLS